MTTHLRAGAITAMFVLACSGKTTPEPAPAQPEAPAAAPEAPAAAPEAPAAAPEAPAEKTQAPQKAKPKPDPAMDAAARAQYRKALDDGRKAHRDKDYPAAIAAFDRALALFADDPRALNERGWARYKGGDLDGAEADTRSALGRTVDARLIGASWYNLGRVLEDRKQLDEAKTAYRHSLAARPNAIVRARLARLDPNVARPLAASRVDGPFADEGRLCAHLKAAAEGDTVICVPPGKTPIAGAPFGARFARTFVPLFDGPDAKPDLDASGTMYWHLVFDLPAGRFVLTNFAATYNPGAFGIYEEIDFEGPTARTLPDGRTLLWIEAKRERRDSDMGLNEVELWSLHATHVCGVGASGVPACIGPLPTVTRGSREIMFEEDDEPGMQHDLWSQSAIFSVELLDSGALEVKPVGQPSKGSDTAHVGVHRLEFP